MAAGGIQNNPNAAAGAGLQQLGTQLAGRMGQPPAPAGGVLGPPPGVQSSAIQQALLRARGQAAGVNGLRPAGATPAGGMQLQGGSAGDGMQTHSGQTSGGRQEREPLQGRGEVQQGQVQSDQAAGNERAAEHDRLMNEQLGPMPGESPADYAARTVARQKRLMELQGEALGDPNGTADATTDGDPTDQNGDGSRDSAQPGADGGGTPWGDAAGGIVRAVGGDLGNVAGDMSAADRISQRGHFGDVEAGWDELRGNAERLYGKDARAAAEGAAREQMNSDINGQRDAQLRMMMGQQSRGGQQTSGGATGVFNSTQANLAKGNRMLTQDAYDREMKSAGAQADLLNDVNQQKKDYLDDSYTSRQKLLAFLTEMAPDDISLIGDIG